MNKDYLLLAEYQLRLNYWEQEVAKLKKEIKELTEKQNGQT